MSTIQERLSTPQSLGALEEVINTGTPVWYDYGDVVTIKLDADVNGQLWYVLKDTTNRHTHYSGEVPCWCFPHFNGEFNNHAYVPTPLCFATLSALVASEEFEHWTSVTKWVYDTGEYKRRQEVLEESQP